jgi:hypothetical protein
MTRVRLALLAAAAALSVGCGGKSSAPARANFKLPASIAAFQGAIVHGTDPTQLNPYFAVANEARDDLTLINATNDQVLDAPVVLRPLAITFPDRPALLASASLGDGKADLLVGVSSGSSVLQLVRTWLPEYTVDADTTSTSGGAVELGADILAIVALPRAGAAAGSAQLAVALAGNRLAVVTYTRPSGTVVIPRGTVSAHALGLEVAALAVAPGDAAHVYAATRDPIGTAGVLGVAQIDVSNLAAEPWPVTALDARGPTRLVAAAVLKERIATGAAALARDASAFAGQSPVTRVYAVLDEGGCGVGHRIDCGIVTLDPATGGIPPDWSGVMPYRAPIGVPSRPLALVVQGPPAVQRSDAAYAAEFMRLATDAETTYLTTAVGAVPSESGLVTFLDLGRFKVASTTNAPIGAKPIVSTNSQLNRLWIRAASGAFASSDSVSTAVGVTPGWTRDETWTLTYQGPLPGLLGRPAEMWWDAASGKPKLAIQVGEGTPGAAPRTFSEVTRLYHPALGVRVGDIVAVKVDAYNRQVAAAYQCPGEVPAGTATGLEDTVPKEFEAVITSLLPPSDAAPGGAVLLDVRTRLLADTGTAYPEPPLDLVPGKSINRWEECFQALTQALQAGATLRGLVVTVGAGTGADDPEPARRGSWALLTGASVGYAGRPKLGTDYALQYQPEDALATQCPLADWDGSFPLAASLDCGGAGCDRAVCEQLVLARKARRQYHLSEDCTPASGVIDGDCQTRYQNEPYYTTFPVTSGPIVKFRPDHQVDPAAENGFLVRGLLSLRIQTTAGVAPLAYAAGGTVSHSTGGIAFDRSPWAQDDGYRFVVLFPGGAVADASPSVSPISGVVLR